MKYAKKFRTAAEMEAAYQQLQAAYTKKCQEAREAVAGPPPQPETPALPPNPIADYLRAITQGQAPAVLTGGAPPLTPQKRPESFEEAGHLARRMFGE